MPFEWWSPPNSADRFSQERDSRRDEGRGDEKRRPVRRTQGHDVEEPPAERDERGLSDEDQQGDAHEGAVARQTARGSVPKKTARRPTTTSAARA